MTIRLTLSIGISYAIRRHLLKPLGMHEFRNGPQEDYCLLHDLLFCSQDILVSGRIAYHVRGFTLPDYRRVDSSILLGKDSCDSREVIDNYVPPYDFKTASTRLLSLFSGVQEASVRASESSCVDAFFFQKLIKVLLLLTPPPRSPTI